MTLAAKLTALASAKAAIKAALTTKGANLTGIPFTEWADEVDALSTGSAGVETRAAWTKPADWLELPTVTAGEHKFVGLYAVFDCDINWLAMSVNGSVTIDWGDGTVENFSGDSTPTHKYNYSTMPAGTLSSRGYKQALVTVTAQAGQSITGLAFSVKHPDFLVGTQNTGGQWLDICYSLPGLTITTPSSGHSQLCLERVRVKDLSGLNSLFNAFPNFTNVKHFELAIHANLTTLQVAFNGCSQLRSVVITGPGTSLTNISGMFSGCAVLQEPPMFDTSNVTDMSQVFQNCYILSKPPLWDTSKVTTMQSMFNGCVNLETIPLYNTGAVTNMASMFGTCRALKELPLLNTENVTSMSSMFSTCTSLPTVPLFNTIKLLNAGSMFSGCARLESVPAFNLAAVTNVSFMFNGCRLLKEVPLFVWPALRATTGMFTDCTSLQKVAAIDMSLITDVSSMFSNCTSITVLPPLNLNAVTSFNSFIPSQVARMVLNNLKVGPIALSNTRMSGAAIDEFFTGLGTIGSPITITLTNAPGAATCTRTIATAKGWATFG